MRDSAPPSAGPVSVTPRALSWTPPAVASTLPLAASLLKSARRVLVVAHERPDGDAIGSTVGAMLALEQLGLDVVGFNVDPLPHAVRWLPQADRIVSSLGGDWTPDVTLVLDCSRRERVGAGFPAAGWGGRIVCLDHHETYDPEFADVLVRDVRAASTTELVYRLVVELGVTLTPDLATALFVGVQTDTGSFRYDSTTRETMELAERLLETRLSVWESSSRLYESQPLARVRLLGLVLATLDLSPCGRLASLVVTPEMLKRAGAESSLADGFIQHARGIEGVEIATMLTADGDGFLVSFRSRGRLDVVRVAEHFGGGGHRFAAGCRIVGALEEVRQRLHAALDAVLPAPA